MTTLELEKYIGVNVQRAALKLNNYYQKVVSPFDITVDQWEILVILWEKEGITQKEIAERLDKDQTNIARMLFKLEKKGFIYRVIHETDRRSLRVYLTPKGREIKDDILEPSIEAYKNTIKGLSEEEVETFRRILTVIRNNVKDL
jgi:DNA-binding MarR family transcriptional regulator